MCKERDGAEEFIGYVKVLGHILNTNRSCRPDFQGYCWIITNDLQRR